MVVVEVLGGRVVNFDPNVSLLIREDESQYHFNFNIQSIDTGNSINVEHSFKVASRISS